MTLGSLFTGIGGFDLGFEHAGLRCKWQVEIDGYCRRQLERHFHGVDRFTDIRDCGRWNLTPVDVICGGFPCQDVSVIGRRKGLAGERSSLWFEFHRVLAELKPRFAVIENVPGLLSSNEGRDFEIILSGLEELGYCAAWRTLDSRYFGVAQRRRRVFIVASLGSGSCAEILFESESVPGDSAPGKDAREGVATTLRSRPANSDTKTFMTFIVFDERNVTSRANRTQAEPGRPSNTLLERPAWHENKGGSFSAGEIARALRAGASHSYQGVGVRRLTPTECARLQGFPDDWLEGSDSAKYRALGNAVTVPVAEWIGRRIMRGIGK